jgi:hypothetical protein
MRDSVIVKRKKLRRTNGVFKKKENQAPGISRFFFPGRDLISSKYPMQKSH